MNKKHILWIVGAGFAASLAIVLAVALPASAQTVQASVTGGAGSGRGGHYWVPGSNGGMKMAPGVFGTVTAVNGTTLTVTSKPFMRPNSTSTPTAAIVYTVNAGSATVYKNNATSTIASVATGDMVMVQGTVTGTNVAATVIRDGLVPGPGGPGGMGRPGMGGFGRGSSSTFQGNGEPIVGGNITAISGTTLTVMNTSNVTYTIDASSAKIVKNGTTTTLSALATGDSVVVQGTVNGTSVTASSIIDQATSTSHSARGPDGGGFFGAISSFFKHIFGF